PGHMGALTHLPGGADGDVLGDPAHLQYLRPPVGEQAVAHDEAAATAGQLPRHRLHGIGPPARHNCRAVGVVGAAQDVDGLLHHAHESRGHVVQRVVGEDDGVFQQSVRVDAFVWQAHLFTVSYRGILAPPVTPDSPSCTNCRSRCSRASGSSRLRMVSTALGLASTSTYRRRSWAATAPRVPLPAKKSSAQSSGRVEACTMRRTMPSGFWVGYPVFSLPGVETMVCHHTSVGSLPRAAFSGET